MTIDEAMGPGRDVVVFGTGDLARTALVYLKADSPHRVAAFTVHEDRISASTLLGLDVVPFEGLLESHPPDRYAMLVAVGFKRVNQARAAIYEACKGMGYQLISYVSSKASHVGHVEIGDNCFILEQNVLQPFVQIGNNVIMWSGNHVGHDVVIEDHCFIASHAVISGRVRIGSRSFVGVNATFRDGVHVAPECVIGAGAVILRDTNRGQVYAAARTQPAKVASRNLKSFE